MIHNGPQLHETARVDADTHPHPLGALRATCAFLAGAAVNIVATVCMVAYSEACRRREDERESIQEEVGGMSGQDVLRERIADTVRQHRPGASIVAYTCDCGVPWTSEHVADAVVAALGLTEDWDEDCWDGGSIPIRRWTTPWERIEEDG